MKKKKHIIILIGYILLTITCLATAMVYSAEAIIKNPIYYWIGIPLFIIFLTLMSLPINRWCGLE